MGPAPAVAVHAGTEAEQGAVWPGRSPRRSAARRQEQRMRRRSSTASPVTRYGTLDNVEAMLGLLCEQVDALQTALTPPTSGVPCMTMAEIPRLAP